MKQTKEATVKEVMVEVLQTINRRNFIEMYALSNDNKKVQKLRKIERLAKRIYKVNTKVIYVDIKFKKLLIRDSVRGYYNSKDNYAVVFVNNDYRANVTTLCHELTHAYQNIYMNKEYIKSTKDLKEGRVTYAKAWHEVHAREQAAEMCTYFLDEVLVAAA